MLKKWVGWVFYRGERIELIGCFGEYQRKRAPGLFGRLWLQTKKEECNLHSQMQTKWYTEFGESAQNIVIKYG